ncbi:MAG: hypothetical protein N2234_08865, partial [Planctomycetota bacterium]|nr:hypothetical protein [Planctomycetota bacterium]
YFGQVVEVLRKSENVNVETLLEPLEKIVKYTPGDKSKREELALAYVEAHRLQDAIKEYENLTNSAIEEKNLEEALSYCKQMQKLEPLRLDTMRKMVEIYSLKGESELKAEVLQQMAWLLVCMSDYEAAAKIIEESASTGASDLGSLLLLANIYRKSGKTEDLSKLLLRLAATAVKQQDIGLAERFLNELARMDCNDERFFDLKSKLERLKTLLKEADRMPVIERPRLSDRIKIVRPSSQQEEGEKEPTREESEEK